MKEYDPPLKHYKDCKKKMLKTMKTAKLQNKHQVCESKTNL